VLSVDAVITCTALHWLSEDALRRLYTDLAELIRPEGVFAHAEVMPIPEASRLQAELRRLGEEQGRRGDRPDWDAWWREAEKDPVLAEPAIRRRRIFATNYPLEEFSPSADWHVDTLTGVGFSEAAVVWRSGAAAVVAAVR
jgi:hypothetical protein